MMNKSSIIRSRGFTLIETVMTLVMVGLAMGAAAMVLSTGAKILQQRSAVETRNLLAENCIERMEVALYGRSIEAVDKEALQICSTDVKITIEKMSMVQTGENPDERGKGKVMRVVPDPAGDLRLVTVSSDHVTFRRLFTGPTVIDDSAVVDPEPDPEATSGTVITDPTKREG